MRKGYVAYIRVAHKDEYAVESQKLYIENYAKSKNIKIDCYYVDDGYSGRKFDRPQLIQMLREVKSRRITKGIIVKDMSRLGRDNEVIYKIMNRISRRNINLISTLEAENLQNTIMLSIMKWQKEDELKRKQMGQKFMEDRGALIENPYKRGTPEDIEYRKQKVKEMEEKGICHISFRYKDEIKRRVSKENVRN